MSVIVFSGAKGGVGVTTLAVNIAATLAERRPVRLLALGDGRDWFLHLRGEMAKAGVAPPLRWRPHAAGGDLFWAQAPKVSENLRAGALAHEDDALPVLGDGANQSLMRAEEGGMLIVDAPPLPISRALLLAPSATLIHVLGADAASLTRVLQWRREIAEVGGIGEDWTIRYVLNLVDPRRPLCRDLAQIAADALGPDLILNMTYDAAVPSAAADGALIAAAAPHAQAAHDLAALADVLDPVPQAASLPATLSA